MPVKPKKPKKPKKLKKDMGKRERIMDTKWAAMERLGFERPKTAEENLRRIREAH